MEKEELIGKLQMVYVGDRNALNELIGYYDGLKEVIEIVQQENKQLKDRINKIDKHVSSLSSVGRGCEIYADVKREILKVVRGNNDDK